MTRTPAQMRELAATMRVKVFFANDYTICTGCNKEIQYDDLVRIDAAGIGLCHEDCDDEH